MSTTTLSTTSATQLSNLGDEILKEIIPPLTKIGSATTDIEKELEVILSFYDDKTLSPFTSNATHSPDWGPEDGEEILYPDLDFVPEESFTKDWSSSDYNSTTSSSTTTVTVKSTTEAPQQAFWTNLILKLVRKTV